MNERRPYATTAAGSAYDEPKGACEVARAPEPSHLEKHGASLQKTIGVAQSLVMTLRRRLQGLEHAFGDSKPESPKAESTRPTPIALPHLRSELDSLLDEAHGLLEQLGRYIP